MTTWRVAPGKLLTIAGRDYTGGEQVPEVNPEIMRQLEQAGVVMSDKPARKADRRGIEE